MKFLILISLLISVSGCTEQPKKIDTIQGNWRQITGYYPDYISVGYAHFSGDSVLLNASEYQDFTIRNDSLILSLNHPYDHEGKEVTREVRYLIEYLSKDSLVIKELQENWKGFENITDTIKYTFSRFTKLANPPKLSKIEFASGWCYGKCPQRDVIIDSSGYLYYRPQKYDPLQTPLTSTNAKELFNEISFLVSSIPVTFLDTLNGYYNEDSQRLITNLIFENGLEKQIISDHDNSLMPIFMKLEHSVNFVQNLRPADTLKLRVREKVNGLPD